MATEFLMPKLGLTMEEGTITEWFADDGATITAGEPLLRIETDKTETDVEAAATGRLHRIGQVGETFSCGDRIGWFLDDGEAAPETAQPAAPPTTATATGAAPPAPPAGTPSPPPVAVNSGRVIASPLTKRLAAERNIDLRTVRGTGPGGRIVAADLDDLPTTATAPTAGRQPARSASIDAGPVAPATAAARSLADLLGIDLARVPVDPVELRITKESVAWYVRSLIAAGVETPATSPSPSPAPSASPPTLLPAMQDPSRTIRLSGVRGTIAKRMHESLRQMAQLTLFMEADLDAVVADRSRRKDANGTAPGYTDYVIAAVARALVRHPLVNSQITDDGVALLPTAHVGMAVALEEGLIVPVIRHTASLDLDSLSVESTRLAAAARSGSLELPDLEGGTFSVSTLGMYGVDGFTPVINPPNTAILGVGRIRDDLILDEGQVGVRKRMTLSLTWDHRAFDGAPAAAFCQTVVELLADPTALDRI
jgi:pyruvate dehydrogenase E2 component (dihydrolipoamide acetyltransferase)